MESVCCGRRLCSREPGFLGLSVLYVSGPFISAPQSAPILLSSLLCLVFESMLILHHVQPGISNFGESLKAGRNPAGGKFLGTFREVWQCEIACLTSAEECLSFTFMPISAHKVCVCVLCVVCVCTCVCVCVCVCAALDSESTFDATPGCPRLISAKNILFPHAGPAQRAVLWRECVALEPGSASAQTGWLCDNGCFEHAIQNVSTDCRLHS